MPEELLQQLRDIHQPPAAGWWPPAPGWWLLAGLLLAVTATLVIWYYRRQQRNRFLAPANRILAELEARRSDDPGWYGELNQLLKRVARVRYPNAGTDTLTGEDWVCFLASTSDLASDDCRRLALATVDPYAGLSPSQALSLAGNWLRQQRC
ncbi:DUF4381 domain-containing protein [uncultured Marinobacter sp.]|uniref:DUF4381 domain-containing protein n=1 Tax=uncultured Marinobacter sp. TaxID=187379 RepID=UPI0030D7FCF2